MKRSMLFFVVVCALSFVQCTKDNESSKSIELTTLVATLNFGDNFQIAANSKHPLTYTSDNEYHAAVSSSGLVTARFVGETSISIKSEFDFKKVKVTVKPEYVLYPDPLLEFGKSRSSIIAKLGTPGSETADAIAYTKVSNAADIVMYTFDKNNNLEGVGVMVKTSYSSDLGGYLVERFFPVSIEDRYFVNAIEASKITLAVIASLYNTSYWLVMYAKYTPSSTKSAVENRDAISKLIEEFS